jgi:hypothetical protein
MMCPYRGVSAFGGAKQGSTLLCVHRSMCSPVNVLLYIYWGTRCAEMAGDASGASRATAI